MAAHATGSVRSRPSEIGIPAGSASASPVSGCRPKARASRTAYTAATVSAARLTSSSASSVETPGSRPTAQASTGVAIRCCRYAGLSRVIPNAVCSWVQGSRASR